MRILVIDDDEIFCRLLVEFLEQIGVEATCRTDGLEAFELLNRETYDLCIIDVRMPLVLGSDLAEAIKEAHPQIIIILASAFPDHALQEYASRKGILLLAKPFTKMQLFDTVKIAVAESIGRN
ncbi:MAG TPA: response regulator [Acidobacteriota bacterium]|nr:response regulator [Acidobacteriota bacterium]